MGFPTVAIESSFSAPLVYGDVAVVELSVERMGISSVTFGYRIHRKRDGVLCFRASITTVLVSIDTMKPIALSAESSALFERLLSTRNRGRDDSRPLLCFCL